MKLLGIVITVWYVWKLRKIYGKEKEIFDIKNQIDNLEHDDESKRRTNSGMVNQSAFNRIIEKRKKPLTDKLEKLKMERQFMLEKLPLVGIFRR